MKSLLRSLVCLSATAILASPAECQGPYYVNGQTGLDAPTHGASPATPWKTIGYAMAHVPQQTPSTSEIVYVEGNQTYSPTTNGEVFPITPAYNVALEGTFVGHGAMPILAIPAGQAGFVFPANQWINRNQVTYRYLILSGGDYGMRMGADIGFRHRPRVQDCTFTNQARAGVRIDNSGTSINDPRFFQNLFTGPGNGIEIFAIGNNAITQPDVEENRFRNLGGTAIDVDDRSPGGGNVGGLFRSNWFESCDIGIRIRSAAGAVATNAIIRTSRFAHITNHAIDVVLDHPLDPNVTVEDCAILHCGNGVRLSGNPLPGSYTLTMTRNVVRQCGVGLNVALNGQGNVAVHSRDNVVELCGIGLHIDARTSVPSGLSFDLTSSADRWLRCTTGARLTIAAPGSVSLGSSMFCANTLYGLHIAQVQQAQLHLHNLTIADNPIGILATSSAPAGSTFDNLLLSANTSNITGFTGTVITHSCFHGSTWPGTGNLSADPLLQHPFYKLAPTSPCLDAGNPATSASLADYEGDPRASVSALNGPARADIGADEYVLAGSARRYGTAGFGVYNVFPHIGATSTQAPIGGTIDVRLADAIMPVFGIPATWAALSFGWRDDPGSLSFDLAAFGMAGSYLWNDAATALPLQAVSPSGTASYQHTIPNWPSLVGTTFTYQWFALMPQTYGVVSSDGLRVTLGR